MERISEGAGMKTLDEVIFEAPYSLTPWEADALNYLKEYQGYLIGKEINEAFDEAFTEIYNPPLTWDELEQMEGKPVWIEGPCITGGPHWIIVGPSHLYNEKITGYGKAWQAYRKEKE